MTPQELAKEMSVVVEKIPVSELRRLSPNAALQIALQQNILGMLTVIAQQQDLILKILNPNKEAQEEIKK